MSRKKLIKNALYFFMFLPIPLLLAIFVLGYDLDKSKSSYNELSLEKSKLTEKVATLEQEVAGLEENQNQLELENQSLKSENQSLNSEIDEMLNPKGGVKEHGKLKVIGTQLCDESGSPVQLRGFSSHGLTWYPEYTNYSTLKNIRDYGANVFRIAMYVEDNKSYTADKTLNKKLMYQAIENSLAADLYTIVDWHVLNDENPNNHVDEAMEFFAEIARNYADEPGIIYEICNEPSGDTTWEDIATYANKIIPVIRQYSPDSVIIVGTPKHSVDIGSVIGAKLDYDNVMYTLHFYVGMSDLEHVQKRTAAALENGVPVFISEWGIKALREDMDLLEMAADIMEYMNDENISWVNWSLSNKNEPYSLFKAEEWKFKDWDEASFTKSGKFILELLEK